MNIKINEVKKVFSDGRHNAFTSICSHNDEIYIAFRNAENHLSENGKIIVIKSKDCKDWEQIYQLHNDSGDLRDPKIVSHNGQLLIFSGMRIKSDNGYKIKSICFCSQDGSSFILKELKGIKANSFIWGINVHNNIFYGTAYTYMEDRQVSRLYKSGDGLNWKFLTTFPEPGNETDIDFDDRERLFALLRNEIDPWHPTLYITKSSSFDDFDSVNKLPFRLQGPMLKRLDNGCLIVGRTWDMPGRLELRTELYWYKDNGSLKRIGTLPSGGDCSYAAWYSDSAEKAFLSYYSAHEHILKNKNCLTERNEHNCSADIFLAELLIEQDN